MSETFELLASRTGDIFDSKPAREGIEIGRSREGRPIVAHRFGSGARISLIGGCHADEPVGPRLLRRLAGYLDSLPPNDPMLAECQWWIVPHVNPDGELRNRSWYTDSDTEYDVVSYLENVVREKPGDDMEFGFPRSAEDSGARPENRAVSDWWRSDAAPLAMHVSLHGMAFAAGPWFLLEETWIERLDVFRERCRGAVERMGYRLHDVERNGEKGFFRIGSGFCTRPDSRKMREFFLDQDDAETAQKFRPSSMETARRLGPDVLTLVSEMPLFLTPGVGEVLGPPDPVAEEWKSRVADWRARLAQGGDRDAVREEAARAGLSPMPVADQMTLQWLMIAAGWEAVGN